MIGTYTSKYDRREYELELKILSISKSKSGVYYEFQLTYGTSIQAQKVKITEVQWQGSGRTQVKMCIAEATGTFVGTSNRNDGILKVEMQECRLFALGYEFYATDCTGTVLSLIHI